LTLKTSPLEGAGLVARAERGIGIRALAAVARELGRLPLDGNVAGDP